jgi:hypothetical protein
VEGRTSHGLFLPDHLIVTYYKYYLELSIRGT